MNKSATQINYTQIVRDIKAILAQGREAAEKALQRQVLMTNWEVGRYLTKELPFEEAPSSRNAGIIKRLAGTFGQPEVYFYMVIKLYKYYPKLSQKAPELSWSHYLALISIGEEKRRAKYERLAVEQAINAKDLYAMITRTRGRNKDKARVVYAGTGAPQLPVVRGKLYHYMIAGPKRNEKNTGTVTIDIGFNIFRDIAVHKKKKIRAGLMARTLKNGGAPGTAGLFGAKLVDTGKAGADHHSLYTYKAQVERVIDGDTLVCMVDLGLKTKTRQTLRLRGIDCPEVTTARGRYAKKIVKGLLEKQDFVIVKTYKEEKYGRMLADVYYRNAACKPGAYRRKRGRPGLRPSSAAEVVAQKGTFLNQYLLDEGLAEVWRG